MTQEIIKGIAVGIGCILIIVAIGMSIGFACSGNYEGEVDPPEEAERVGQIEHLPSTAYLRG